jgi:nucleotide-binding universal stress UspA family protein
VRQVSSTAFLSLLMVTFVCIGFVLAIVMGRLGRSPFAWGLLGLVLGPIAMLLALVEVRNERPWWTRLVASGDPGSGPVDVLVGIDGSPESAAATTAGLELLGDRVGRLTLVAVTDLDDSYAGRDERVRLQGELERQAEAVRAWLRKLDGPAQAKQTVVPELQLMAGRPATALDAIAAEDGYDLLVVGARGTGMSSALLGSVATSLAARASVPVLIVGDQVVKGGAERKPRSVDQADRGPDDKEDVLSAPACRRWHHGHLPPRRRRAVTSVPADIASGRSEPMKSAPLSHPQEGTNDTDTGTRPIPACTRCARPGRSKPRLAGRPGLAAARLTLAWSVGRCASSDDQTAVESIRHGRAFLDGSSSGVGSGSPNLGGTGRAWLRV